MKKSTYASKLVALAVVALFQVAAVAQDQKGGSYKQEGETLSRKLVPIKTVGLGQKIELLASDVVSNSTRYRIGVELAFRTETVCQDFVGHTIHKAGPRTLEVITLIASQDAMNTPCISVLPKGSSTTVIVDLVLPLTRVMPETVSKRVRIGGRRYDITVNVISLVPTISEVR